MHQAVNNELWWWWCWGCDIGGVGASNTHPTPALNTAPVSGVALLSYTQQVPLPTSRTSLWGKGRVKGLFAMPCMPFDDKMAGKFGAVRTGRGFCPSLPEF